VHRRPSPGRARRKSVYSTAHSNIRCLTLALFRPSLLDRAGRQALVRFAKGSVREATQALPYSRGVRTENPGIFCSLNTGSFVKRTFQSYKPALTVTIAMARASHRVRGRYHPVFPPLKKWPRCFGSPRGSFGRVRHRRAAPLRTALSALHSALTHTPHRPSRSLTGRSLPTMEPSGRKLVVTSFEEF
jgi:hypothetical protein